MLELRIKQPGARLLLQADARARAAAEAVWGVPFARQSCRAHRGGERATLWLGPEEYLLWQASSANPLPIEELEHSLQTHPHSLVDVSHGQIGLQLAGPQAATVLSGGCPLDLDYEAFPVNMCTRTVLAKAEIVLWRCAPEEFHLEVWRSFQHYVLDLLHEMARDSVDPVRFIR